MFLSSLDLDFGKGVTLKNFIASGKWPTSKQVFTMFDNGFDKYFAATFIILAGMPSGPVEVVGFKLFIIMLSSSFVVGKKKAVSL